MAHQVTPTLFPQISQFHGHTQGIHGEFCYHEATSLHHTQTQGLSMFYLLVYHGPYLWIDFFQDIFPTSESNTEGEPF